MTSATVSRNQSQSGNGDSVEAELEHLKRKYARLESEQRQSLEATQLTIKQNKQLLVSLKQDNKQIKERLTRSNTSGPAGSTHHSSACATSEAALQKWEREVHQLRATYDQLLQDKRRAVERLERLEDNVKQLAQDATIVYSGGSRHQLIRQLENRLEKAMTKANEARSIQCTYEQLLARLKHEQVGFDAALRQLDETAAARAIEVDQLALAARAAQHAGEKARQDAARDEQQLGRERAQRTATLEAQHKDLAALLQPLTLAAAGAAATATSAPDDHGDSKLLSADDAGAAVAQLMAVAGASGRGQLLSRLLQRLEVHRELQHRAEGADTRHADLTKQLQQVTGRLAALREDPVEEAGGGQTPRAVTSAREDRQHRQQQHLPEPSGTGERDTRSRHQQLRNEIHQLVTCVAPLPLSQPPVPLSDETLVDALAQCEQRLRAGLLVLQTDHPEAYAKLMRADDVDSAGAFQTPSAVGEQ